MMNVAQVNIGLLKYNKDDPKNLPFTSKINEINKLAENHLGYVWHLDDSIAGFRYSNDKKLLINISIWNDIDSLKEFTFQGLHAELMQERHKWFTAIEGSTYALWHTNMTKNITIEEAMHRLNFLKDSGPSDYSFNFKYLNQLR